MMTTRRTRPRAFAWPLLIGIGALAATHALQAQRGGQPSAVAPGAAGSPGPAAVRAARERFAGVWKLVGEETRDARGQLGEPGAAARSGGRFGYIVYDPAGYMGVTIAWHARPAFAAERPTLPEVLAATTSYNSYWGSFAVDEGRAVVTHQTFGALSPAFAGTNQDRGFTIAGNRLTLRPPTAANGDQRALTWERVPDAPTLTAAERRLVGFWKLIGRERRTAAGASVSENSGETGFLVYTAAGHVMVHLMQPYRRRNAGPAPTPDETMAVYRTYDSYFGTYSADESGRVAHHVDAALMPGRGGTSVQSSVTLSGRRLTQVMALARDAGGEDVQTTVTWERLSD